MDPLWRKQSIVLVSALAAAGVLFWALRPQPVPVDTAEIVRGALEVTVTEEGRTRVRQVYTVSTPIAGTTERSPREVGDTVTAGETVIAIIRPTVPGFLDARTLREAEAIVAAAEAMVESARAQVREAEAQLSFARSENVRASQLRTTDAVSAARLEQTQTAVSTAEARLASAKATLVAYQHVQQMAKARMAGPHLDDHRRGGQGEGDGNGNGDECCLPIFAPVDGRVLAVHHESEQVVAAGTALVDIGDPRELEVVADLLSSDAVRIPEGAAARIDGWGGQKPLEGRVRHVEPAGFTKVSALGIEEQRVRVILDFAGAPDERPTLGHGYRVMTHIAVERVEDAPLVPLGALFRRGDAWSVFVAGADGYASERVVQIGQRTSREAVVLSGLEAGERVVLHPSDRISEGTRLRERDGR